MVLRKNRCLSLLVLGIGILCIDTVICAVFYCFCVYENIPFSFFFFQVTCVKNNLFYFSLTESCMRIKQQTRFNHKTGNHLFNFNKFLIIANVTILHKSRAPSACRQSDLTHSQPTPTRASAVYRDLSHARQRSQTEYVV